MARKRRSFPRCPIGDNGEMKPVDHDAEIVDQFTRQADPFVERHGRGKDALLDRMVECAEVRPQQSVLDVACGPGIVSCFFARHAAHVTGLDFVPAMLDRARRFQKEQRVDNVDWKQGSSTELPFADAAFDCVVTRFSFHHFLDSQTALNEMKRVAKPGGTVLVADVAPRPEAQEQFNRWEVLRDSSHTRALTPAELRELGEKAGLPLHRSENFPFEMDLDSLLSGSFPRPGDEERIRALFDEETRAGTDCLGVAARREASKIRITYPVAVLAWRKPE